MSRTYRRTRFVPIEILQDRVFQDGFWREYIVSGEERLANIQMYQREYVRDLNFSGNPPSSFRRQQSRKQRRQETRELFQLLTTSDSERVQFTPRRKNITDYW